jgi:hypothetical protein
LLVAAGIPAATVANAGKQLTIAVDGSMGWVADGPATDITGGAPGSIVYQTAANKTGMIPGASKDNQVLLYNGAAGSVPPFHWVDFVHIPVPALADARKPLAVKADGTGAEWGTDLAISKVYPAGHGADINGLIIDGISGRDHVAGTILVNLGQPVPFNGYKGVFVVDQKNGTTDRNLSAAVCAIVGNIDSSDIVRHGFYVNGWNSHFGNRSGVGIIFGAPTYGQYSYERKSKSARIYCETDNSNSSNSRLIFETSAGNNALYSSPVVIWSNGAVTVGVSNVGIYSPPIGVGSIQSKGMMSALEGFQPPSLADTAAANNCIYFSTTANKLVFKDSAGVVHPLYS